MKKLIIFTFFFLSITQLYAFSQSYIVKFKNEKSAKNFIQSNTYVLTNLFVIDKLKINNSLQNNSSFNPSLYYKINTNNQNVILALTSNENIDFIEPNHIYSTNQLKYNDSLFNFQWSLDIINARKSMQTYSGKRINIAVVDSGIDYYHPELKNQFMINKQEDLNGNGTFEPWDYREIRNGLSGDFNGIDEDGNGYVDDVIGYDFVDLDFVHFGDWRSPDPIPDDEAGHGTSVASIIVAEGNNNIGMVGLANQSKVLNVRAFDITGNGETDDIANAIIYAAIRRVDIINMSFGDYFNSKLLEDAIKFASSMGCIMVASAGNDDKATPHYPSDYKEVVCVGSVNKNGKRSSFSNWGTNLSLMAPGEDVITCESGGGYSASNGTSFSAPFVTAAIALYLEKNSKPAIAEMRSHLEATSKKLSPVGWLHKSGSGILDVTNMLEFKGLSNIEIVNIPNYFIFIPKDSLEISISAITPLFKSAQLEIAELNTQNFVPLTNFFSKQLKDEKIKIDFSKQKTDALLSLKVELNNGQILRRLRAVRILKNADSLKILFKNVTSAVKNGKRVVLVSARTNIETNLTIEYFHKDFPDIKRYKYDLENSDKNHFVAIDDLILPGIYKIKGILTPKYNDYNEVNTSFDHEFEFDYQIFPTQNVVQKDYKLPRAYLNNNVLDFFQKNTEQVVINDLSNFVIENAKVYEFSNNRFHLLDTLKDWIPVAFGNSNGNILTDILLTYNGKMMITEATSVGQSPFSKEIYKSNFSFVEWGENFFDLDGDKLDEAIGYNDSSFFALKFNKQQNKFLPMAMTKLPEKSKSKGLTKGSVIWDLDDDGKPELVHSNYYGHIFIYEFDKASNNFYLEFVDTTNYGYSNPILTLIKNKDGTSEVIIATYGTENLFGETSNINQIWNIRSIVPTRYNNYKISNIENIMGVRAGIEPRIRVGFRNGILGADIDKDGQDELIISALPNTYVYRKLNNSWHPYWHYPYSFTNSAIVWDFDKNGVNEIGISTFDSTKFFELPSFGYVIATPQFYDSYTLTNQMAVMKWTKVPNAHFYRVYKIVQNENGEFILKQISKTDIDSLFVIDLTPKQYHYFIVTSVDTSDGIKESNYSEILTIYANAPIYPIKVTAINNNTLVISFNGKIKPSINEAGNFIVKPTFGGNSILPSSVIANSDSSYILTLDKSLERGEYEIICKPFKDYWNNPSQISSIYFEIGSPQINYEMYLKSLKVVDLNNLIIEFSENVEDESGNEPTNYELKPIGKVVAAQLDVNNKSIALLKLNDDIKNQNSTGEIYSVTAKNIKSRNKKFPITIGAGNTLSFTLVSDNISNVFTFPNPVSLSKDEYIGFGNLPVEFEITIMNLQGTILQKLSDNNARGAIKWDLKDLKGEKLSLGSYIYKITGKNRNGEQLQFEINKFAIVP